MKAQSTLQRAFNTSTISCGRRGISCPILTSLVSQARPQQDKTGSIIQRSASLGRSFSTTQWLSKKGGKAARAEKQETATATSSGDPSDFTVLNEEIQAAIARLKDDLSKLRAGGRFNPEVLENLRVHPDKNNSQTVRLSDVAQVIPRGRTVQILVGENEVRSASKGRYNKS